MMNNASNKISYNAFIFWTLLVGIELFVLFLSGTLSVWIAPVMTVMIVGLYVFLKYEISIKSYFVIFVFILPLLPILPPVLITAISWLGLFGISAVWLLELARYEFKFESVPWYVSSFLVSYLVLCTLATLHSVSFGYSLNELIRLYLIFGFLVIVFNLIQNVDDIHIVYNSIILSAIVLTILSLPAIMAFSPTDLISGDLIKIRLASFYENANNFSIPFIIAIPIIFVKVFYKNQTRMLWGRVFYFFILGFFLYIVLLTNSRSALLCIMASFFILLLGLKFGRIVIVSFIALFIVLLPFIGKTVFLLLRLERGFTGRDILWKTAIDIIHDHPVLGVGLGNYEFVKYKYIIPTDFFSTFTRSSEMSGAAHNLFLTVASENGLLAGIILYAFILVLFYKVIVLLRKTHNDQVRAVLYIACSILFGLTMRGFFESGIIIGSARINDFVYFLIPVVAIARVETLLNFKKI